MPSKVSIRDPAQPTLTEAVLSSSSRRGGFEPSPRDSRPGSESRRGPGRAATSPGSVRSPTGPYAVTPLGKGDPATSRPTTTDLAAIRRDLGGVMQEVGVGRMADPSRPHGTPGRIGADEFRIHPTVPAHDPHASQGPAPATELRSHSDGPYTTHTAHRSEDRLPPLGARPAAAHGRADGEGDDPASSPLGFSKPASRGVASALSDTVTTDTDLNASRPVTTSQPNRAPVTETDLGDLPGPSAGRRPSDTHVPVLPSLHHYLSRGKSRDATPRDGPSPRDATPAERTPREPTPVEPGPSTPRGDDRVAKPSEVGPPTATRSLANEVPQPPDVTFKKPAPPPPRASSSRPASQRSTGAAPGYRGGFTDAETRERLSPVRTSRSAGLPALPGSSPRDEGPLVASVVPASRRLYHGQMHASTPLEGRRGDTSAGRSPKPEAVRTPPEEPPAGPAPTTGSFAMRPPPARGHRSAQHGDPAFVSSLVVAPQPDPAEAPAPEVLLVHALSATRSPPPQGRTASVDAARRRASIQAGDATPPDAAPVPQPAATDLDTTGLLPVRHGIRVLSRNEEVLLLRRHRLCAAMLGAEFDEWLRGGAAERTAVGAGTVLAVQGGPPRQEQLLLIEGAVDVFRDGAAVAVVSTPGDALLWEHVAEPGTVATATLRCRTDCAFWSLPTAAVATLEFRRRAAERRRRR